MAAVQPVDAPSASAGTGRPRGLRAIIAYKFVKAGVVLPVALLLTLAPHGSLRVVHELIGDLAEAGGIAARLAGWLQAHLSMRGLAEGAVVAWLDGLSTGLEGYLLFRGKVWGEWLVIGILALLLPAELVLLEERPSLPKLVVLIVNAAVVAYLVHRRLPRRTR